jgi:hypothetical protein
MGACVLSPRSLKDPPCPFYYYYSNYLFPFSYLKYISTKTIQIGIVDGIAVFDNRTERGDSFIFRNCPTGPAPILSFHNLLGFHHEIRVSSPQSFCL